MALSTLRRLLTIAKKIFTIELGSGVDMHGQDVTKAAERAVRDAISHQAMRGLFTLVGLGRENRDAMLVDITVATPFPEKVDVDQVSEALRHIPPERKTIKIIEGGLLVPVERDPPVMAVACIVVLVDTDKL